MKQCLLLLFLFLTASCATHVGKPGRPAPTAVKVKHFTIKKDIVYTPKGWPQALHADLYQPRGTGPWPAVLLIHGGAWTGKDRRSDMVSIARRLTRRGYVVLNATYRLAPEHRHPAQVKDLQEAVRWMRSHATELNLQKDRIAAFGYSAGGQLAALLGSVNASPDHRFQAVVAGGAPVDLRKFPESPMASVYLGGILKEKPSAYADSSPVTHITRGDPPVFIYHGTRDRLVPPDQAADYKKALDQAEIPNELLWQRGRGHVQAFLFDKDAIEPAMVFLDRYLRM